MTNHHARSLNKSLRKRLIASGRFFGALNTGYRMASYGCMWETGNRKSTCLYLETEVVETARHVGLNMSKVSENALSEAIRRLQEPRQETSPNSPAHTEGRGRDLNPGARLHRPVGYQATSPRPLFPHSDYFCSMLIYVF